MLRTQQILIIIIVIIIIIIGKVEVPLLKVEFFVIESPGIAVFHVLSLETAEGGVQFKKIGEILPFVETGVDDSLDLVPGDPRASQEVFIGHDNKGEVVSLDSHVEH